MTNAEVILILGVALIAGGSFLAGLAVSQLSGRGRRRGRHAKGKGKHAK
jgi:hypothetical protein